MFRSFETKDFLILATFVTSDDDVKLITTSGTGITTPEQLKGKRIGTVIGAASDYYLHTLLVLNGIDPKLVHVTHLQPEDMAEALANAQVDAIAIWEPNAFQVLKSVPGATLLTKSGFYIETFNLVARSELKGVRDDDLLKLLRALERAERFIQNEPAKAQAILRTRLQTNQSFIDWIWPRFHYQLTLNQALLMTLEGEARWAMREGLVKGTKTPNYLEYIYPGLLNKIRANTE